MAASLSATLEVVIHDYITGGPAPTATYATQYLAVFVGALPTPTGGTECTDGNYQRHQITWGAGSGMAPRTKALTNGFQAFDKGGATGAAAAQQVYGLGIYDAPTGGNLLQVDPFVDANNIPQPVSVAAGAPYNFAAAALVSRII